MTRGGRALARALATGLLCGALVAPPAAAQEWALGVEAGLDRSDLEGDAPGVGAAEPDRGFRGGAVVRYTLSPGSPLALGTGATFARKGAVSPDADLNLDYLEIPVLLLLNVPLGDAPVQPRLFGGGSFGFELDCEIAPAGDEGGAANCADAGLGETASVDVGVRFGGGLDVRLRRDAAMILDAGYELGLTDLTEAAGGELENRNLYFTAGFLMRP